MKSVRTQSDTRANGNTYKNIRSRNWLFTLNNFSDTERDDILAFSEKNCEKYAIQTERGEEGTLHLQGALIFKNAWNFNSMKKKIPRAHIEASNNKNAILTYCQKDETFEGERWLKNIEKTLVISLNIDVRKWDWFHEQFIWNELEKCPDVKNVTIKCDEIDYVDVAEIVKKIRKKGLTCFMDFIKNVAVEGTKYV